MNIAQLARKFGQAIAPVRISVSGVAEILGGTVGVAAQAAPSGSPPRSDPSPPICLTLNSWPAPTSDASAITTKTIFGHDVARNSRAGAYARMVIRVGGRRRRSGTRGSGIQDRGRKHGRGIPEMQGRGIAFVGAAAPRSAGQHTVFEAAVTGGRAAAGMATTVVACALRYDRVTVAHVGDSRCYLIRQR